MRKRKRREHKTIKGIKHKYCVKCDNWLSLDLFSRYKANWDGLRPHCKLCNCIYTKKYIAANREKVLKRYKLYHAKNREKRNQQSREWKKKNEKYVKEARKNNYYKDIEFTRKRKRKYQNKYSKTSKGNLCNRMRAGVYQSLKGLKNGPWQKLVGYTVDDLIEHLKTTMPEGFTWDDYLSGKLHIDHILPISSFSFTKPEHQGFKDCWALKNLQLLTAFDNLSKGSFCFLILPTG